MVKALFIIYLAEIKTIIPLRSIMMVRTDRRFIDEQTEREFQERRRQNFLSTKIPASTIELFQFTEEEEVLLWLLIDKEHREITPTKTISLRSEASVLEAMCDLQYKYQTLSITESQIAENVGMLAPSTVKRYIQKFHDYGWLEHKSVPPYGAGYDLATYFQLLQAIKNDVVSKHG
jgi:hypothetical protein